MGIPLICWVRGQLTVWRYRRTASGAKTAVIAADQTSASRTWPVTVWPGGRAPWPRNRPRRALVVTVTGWLTLLAYSGLCGQGEFEVGEVAGAGAVQGMAVPPGIQPDQVERDGAVHVLKVGLGQAAVAGAT